MRQTTRINGKRVVISTSAKGKVTVKDAPPLEEDLQAAQVEALQKLPECEKRFTFAGDMNAGKRGSKARARALATGMRAGELDVRLYFEGGRTVLIENKVGRSPLSPAQEKRHKTLKRLGFDVRVVRATSPEEAADKMVAIVREVLGTAQRAA